PEEKVHLVDKKRFKDTLDNPKGVIHKHDIEPGQEEDFAKSKQAAKQSYEATHALGDTGKKIREKYSKDFYSATIFEDMDSLRETTTAMNTEIAVQAEDNEQATRYVQDSQRLLTTEDSPQTKMQRKNRSIMELRNTAIALGTNRKNVVSQHMGNIAYASLQDNPKQLEEHVHYLRSDLQKTSENTELDEFSRGHADHRIRNSQNQQTFY